VAEVLDVPIWGPVVRLTRQPEPAGANAVLYRTYATLPEILAQGRNARRWFPMSPSTGTLLFPSQGRLLAADPAVNRPAGSGESAAPNRYGAHPDRLNRLVLEPATEDVLAPPPPDPGGNAVTPTLIAGVRAIPAVFARGDALAEDQNGRRSPNGQGVLSPVPGGLALLDAFVLDDRGASPFDAPKRTVAPDGEIDFEERALAEDRRFRLARNFEGKLTPGLININTAPVEVLRAMPHMTRLVYDDDFPIAPTAESSPDELDVLDGSELAGETLASRRRAFDPMAPDLGIPQLFAAGAEMAVPATAGTGGFDPFDTGAAGSAVPQIELNDDFGLALGAPASVLPPPASPRVRVAESIDLWRTRGNVDWTPLAGSAPGSVLREPADADMPSYFLRGETTGDPAVNHLLISPGMRATRGFDSLGELALITKGASLGFSVNPAGTVGADADIRDIARRIAPDVNRNGIDDRDPGEQALATDPAVANDRWNRVVGWSIAMPGLDPFRASWDAPGAGLGVSSPVQAIRDLGLASGDPLPYWVDGLPALVSTSPPPTAGVQVVTQHLPLSGRTSLDPHLLSIATDDPGTIDNELTTDVVESSEDELRGTPERITRRDLTAGDAIERNQLLRGISNIVTTRSDVFTVWVRVRTIRQDPLTGVWNGTDPEMILDDSRYLMTVDRSSVDRPGEEPRIISFVKVPK
jgi:hypothetical protein